MTGIQVSRGLSISCLAVFGFGLFFRAVFYTRIYIARGDPYGLADLIEFALGWLLIGILVVSIIVALVLAVRGPRNNRVAAAWLAAVVVLVVVFVQPLHTLAAKWALP